MVFVFLAGFMTCVDIKPVVSLPSASESTGLEIHPLLAERLLMDRELRQRAVHLAERLVREQRALFASELLASLKPKCTAHTRSVLASQEPHDWLLNSEQEEESRGMLGGDRRQGKEQGEQPRPFKVKANMMKRPVLNMVRVGYEERGRGQFQQGIEGFFQPGFQGGEDGRRGGGNRAEAEDVPRGRAEAQRD